MASEALSELLLSSTHAASPLPTTQLHHLTTGSTIFSFKAPHASTSSANSGAAANGSREDGNTASTSLSYRKTMGCVEAQNGLGGVIVGLGGKDGRSGVNVWGFQKEQVLQRLIPPVRLATMALSHGGMYMAGGTADGRIFFWELASGTLLLTIDAHYRAISVLEFTKDDAALISGSEDAGVSVWSIGRLLNATPMNPPTAFATLTDHTLAVTDIAVGLGIFPHCRILTASVDSTCKIWDISTSPPALLTTFSFAAPVTHVAWDPLERFFFAATSLAPGESSAATGSKVTKVALYRKRKDELGYAANEAVGGGGRGDVERVDQADSVEKQTYEISDTTITALHLSAHSPLLLLGTAASTVHVLALPSLLPTRIIPPPPTSTTPGAITFLSTLVRPPDLGALAGSGGGASGTASVLPPRPVMISGQMGRTVRSHGDWARGGDGGRLVEMRVGAGPTAAAMDVDDLVSVAVGGTSTAASKARSTTESAASSRPSASTPTGAAADQTQKVAQLEEEVLMLRSQLGKAVQLNESMWKKIVEGTSLTGGAGGSVEQEAQR